MNVPTTASTLLALLALITLSGATVFGAETKPLPISKQVVATYATIAFRNYSDAVASAKTLEQAIAAFTAAPSATGLVACRQAWLAAREDYGPTEVFRFVGGPIDSDPDNVEVKINGWPLDEQWVDYTNETPQSGIVNAAKDYPALTPELLSELNEKGGEKNLAAGYHALEFLLWGQDLSETGSGARPFTDFVDGGTASNQSRRRAYLNQAASLLVKHLQTVATAWDPAIAGNYRAAFIAEKPEEALKKAFTGIIMLAGDELSGERMAVAYETQDQEEEHSCFSDNTHRDIILNVVGIQNVWLGHYKDIQGPGLRDLVAGVQAPVALKATTQVAAAVAAATAIPVPFDRAIMGGNTDAGRTAVLLSIEQLETTADDLVAAAKAVGIDIEFGANPNNAIVGLQEIKNLLPLIQAAVAANDKSAATAAVANLFGKWIRIETAITRESPTHYKVLESAMNAVKNEAVRAKEPNAERVKIAATSLQVAIDAVLPALKQ